MCQKEAPTLRKYLGFYYIKKKKSKRRYLNLPKLKMEKSKQIVYLSIKDIRDYFTSIIIFLSQNHKTTKY